MQQNNRGTRRWSCLAIENPDVANPMCIVFDMIQCFAPFAGSPRWTRDSNQMLSAMGCLPISNICADIYLSMTTGRSGCEKIFVLYQILPQQTFDLLRKRKKAESQLNSDCGEHILNEFCSTGFGVPRRRVRAAESCADIKLLLCCPVFAFAFL